METIHDIAKTIRITTENAKAHKASPYLAENLTATRTPTRTGLIDITPQQALSIRVERIGLNGTVEGYQRPHTNITHVRRIYDAIKRGKSIEPVTLGLDGGYVYAVDGHNRILAHIMANKPFKAVVEPMTYQERAERFAAQKYQQPLTADNLVLASSDKLARYVKDAIADEQHPFHWLIGMSSSVKTISPSAGYEIIGRYTLNVIGVSGSMTRRMSERRVSEAKLDTAPELARMLRALGTKQSNPLAYRPPMLKSLTDLAVMAVVRTQTKREPIIQRWERHMPLFDWRAYAWAVRMQDIRPPLIYHWNKRLSKQQKIVAE